MYWRCERKDELGCKGRITSQDDDILKATGHNNHTPEATLQEQAEVRDTIDNLLVAVTLTDPYAQIYSIPSLVGPLLLG